MFSNPHWPPLSDLCPLWSIIDWPWHIIIVLCAVHWHHLGICGCWSSNFSDSYLRHVEAEMFSTRLPGAAVAWVVARQERFNVTELFDMSCNMKVIRETHLGNINTLARECMHWYLTARIPWIHRSAPTCPGDISHRAGKKTHSTTNFKLFLSLVDRTTLAPCHLTWC